MKKTNVLFINHSVRDGGPGRSLLYILKYIDREKINPFVLVPKHDIFSESLKSEGIFENVIVDPRFPENIQKSTMVADTTRAPGVLRVFSIIANIVNMLRLLCGSPKIIRENGIDIIYCNGTLAKIVGTLIGRKNKKPVIWHVRNIQQTRFMKSLMERLSGFRCVKKIICVSRATAEPFRRAKNKIHVVYNGIDPADFDRESVRGSLREEFSIPPDTVLVGNTGRVVPRKGYVEFIDTVSRIVSENDMKGKVKFVIVGDTPWFFPKNHLRELEDYAEGLGVRDSFVFTGYREDVRPYLKDFDLFVIPSNYPDPFPRSVIEAMAFALPVVGFSIGGIAEAVEDGETGFLCDPGDFEKIGESISILARDARLRGEMGPNARRRVMEMCSAEDRTADIQKIILEAG
ncbi:MAG: glycosyltransferase family 4 protein [Candidatus Dadabacteria bacterium]|nr:glycosyltransferase family 4 protein [Candidatus Dadabacteria bacterium]MYA48047.1 glycosyltransferase family 4 protein [Candidatus Dadabacteria bacterium]MYG82975.1 glycosyltransferase family 4 protein [Candidatus Dadabacteria bacterium]MYK49114.1 glycosyltransferase family 4 protein [Candidatus Dadabacteria bacterium]